MYGEDNDSLDDIDSQKGPTTFSINRKDDILSKAILENAHVGHLNEALLSFKKALIFAKTPNQVQYVMLFMITCKILIILTYILIASNLNNQSIIVMVSDCNLLF